jgi:uncharacterized Zn finger protein
MWFQFRPYVPVAQRRAQAAREIEKQRKKGRTITPVVIEGRTIARSFWGKAWCDNLESYSDYANRLPRGRTYVRNGSVVDLQIEAGKVTAQVSGSSLYRVTIQIASLPKQEWTSIKSRCAGQIGSLVELLQGRLSEKVMDVVTAQEGGLFPKPRQIKLACSCPDWAGMCKHVAAVLYGVGARLDHKPELLFRLREVDHLELIEEAIPQAGSTLAPRKNTIAASDVADVFGIELAEPEEVQSRAAVSAATKKPARSKRGVKKAPARRRKAKTSAKAAAH